MPTPGHRRSWEDKLARSGLFIAALLFHLLLFLIIAGWIVFTAPPAPPEAAFRGFAQQPARETPPPPPTDSQNPPNVNIDTGTTPTPVAPTVPIHLKITIRDNPIGMQGPSTGAPHLPSTPVNPADLRRERLRIIHDLVLRYRPQDEIVSGDPSATFPVYVASYADGDWACNSRLDAEGNIVGGSMPDLAAKIAEWSHGHILAQVVPKPLNIGGPELLDTMPPFIFFTGHKDFVLTDQEIANLRDYLEKGGAVWGDNALPGKGSRFDIAFRREMKRVVPNPDLTFQPMSLDADLFTKSTYPIADLPAGMNYCSEPIEHLDIDGKLAILYTPNDYGDLLSMRILPGDTEVGPTDNSRSYTSPLITSGNFYRNSGVYFRNFTLPSALAVHRLGMNIVVHLLTRFDDELQLIP